MSKIQEVRILKAKGNNLAPMNPATEEKQDAMITAVGVLPTGAATSSNQTNGTQKADPTLGQGKTLLYGSIAQGAAGTTQLVAAQGTGIKIKVVSYVFTMSVAGTAKFTGPTTDTGAMDIVASGGAVVLGQPSSPLFETVANTALSIVTTGGAAKGHFSYFVEA